MELVRFGLVGHREFRCWLCSHLYPRSVPQSLVSCCVEVRCSLWGTLRRGNNSGDDELEAYISALFSHSIGWVT